VKIVGGPTFPNWNEVSPTRQISVAQDIKPEAPRRRSRSGSEDPSQEQKIEYVGAPTYSSFTLDPRKARGQHHSNKAEFLNCRRADIVHSNPK